jgi:hypothetical protein
MIILAKLPWRRFLEIIRAHIDVELEKSESKASPSLSVSGHSHVTIYNNCTVNNFSQPAASQAAEPTTSPQTLPENPSGDGESPLRLPRETSP